MKRMSMISILLFVASLLWISCNEDETTELAWINGEGSTGAINDIIWGDDDAIWAKTNGYAKGDQTESKEVNQLAGEVACTADTGEEFVEANVTIEGIESSALTLDEGESYVYTLSAEPN